jgi:hypothetical protein
MRALIKIFAITTIFLFISSMITGASIIDSSQENNTIFTIDNEYQELFLLKGRTHFKLYATEEVDSFNVEFSIPPNYIGQAPIYLEILENTSAKIIDYKIENDTFFPNKVINFTVGPMNKYDRSEIKFVYWVLIKNNNYSDIPENIKFPNENNIPEETKIWLSSTESVQSDSYIIKFKTKRFLRKSNNDMITFIDKAIKFVRLKRSDYNPFTQSTKISYYANAAIPTIIYNLFPNKFENLPKYLFTGIYHSKFNPGKKNIVIIRPMFEDALSVHFIGGTCIGQANLAAALFRSASIPSKILIAEPNGVFPNVYHAINEYYVPNYGWIRTDQSKATNLYPYKERMILRVCYPDDENNAGNRLKKFGGTILLESIKHDKIFGEAARGRMYPDENNITLDLNQANDIFNLTQDVWELFTKYAGRDLGTKNNDYIFNATIAQQDAIKCFQASNIEGYVSNITFAYNEYKKIDTS